MLKLKTPFQAVIAGPSGCGKTTFVVKLINESNILCDKKFDKIIWCRSESNAKPNNLKVPTKFLNDIPDEIENLKNENICIVIDDMMGQEGKKVMIYAELFTRGSHHRRLSVLYLIQNLFNQSSHGRTISLNSRYFILFKNPRDVAQIGIGYFARQLCPQNHMDFVRVFKETTEPPHIYLLIDCSQETPDYMRFRTNIFNQNFCEIISQRPTLNSNINGEKIELESIGEEQAYAVCSSRSETYITESIIDTL